MLVLLSNRIFFKYLFLMDVKNPSNLRQRIKIAAFMSFEIFLILPAIRYFIKNIRSLQEATQSSYVVSAFRYFAFYFHSKVRIFPNFPGFSISFGMYCYFFAKQHKIIDILNELQGIIDFSEYLMKSRWNDLRTAFSWEQNNSISFQLVEIYRIQSAILEALFCNRS